tara:strand:+ start:6679 stop:7260 length:582 start_codon:yes stop_codon:yes gene_type:complete
MPRLSLIERIFLPKQKPVFEIAITPTANDNDRCIICLGDFHPTPITPATTTIADTNTETPTCTPIRLLPCTHLVGHTCLQTWLASATARRRIPACVQCTVALATAPESRFVRLVRRAVRSRVASVVRKGVRRTARTVFIYGAVGLVVVCMVWWEGAKFVVLEVRRGVRRIGRIGRIGAGKRDGDEGGRVGERC